MKRQGKTTKKKKRHKAIINAKLSYDTDVGTIRQGILNYCN